MIKAIIVEDEALGRRVLTSKLKEYCPDVEVIDSCATVDESVKSINTLKPDLIFLDVRLNNQTGFDVLRQIDSLRSEVVFVSGYEEYAIQAFREGALDYILKPIDVEELVLAVDKAKERWGKRKNVSRLVVSIAHGIRIIPVRDISYCKGENNYTRIFTKNNTKSVMASQTLSDTYKSLPEERFLQIHKSYIINLCDIHEFHRTKGGRVIMTDGSEIGISNTYRKIFDEKLPRLGEICSDTF